MSNIKNIQNKIMQSNSLKEQVDLWKKNKQKIIFTNGCFDIIHAGHIDTLARSADLGHKLIVGVNSDSSVKTLKGNKRPIIDQKSRSNLIAALSFVDAVSIFDELTPEHLIKTIRPDVIVKGGDYLKKDIIGHKILAEYGGEVIILPFTKGFSTTQILEKISNG